MACAGPGWACGHLRRERGVKEKRPLLRRWHIVDGYGFMTGGALLASLFLGLFVLPVGIFCGVVYGGRAYGRDTCKTWSKQTGVPVKFVVLNWADSGTCLARTPDGHWIVNSQWQAFFGASK